MMGRNREKKIFEIFKGEEILGDKMKRKFAFGITENPYGEGNGFGCPNGVYNIRTDIINLHTGCLLNI